MMPAFDLDKKQFCLGMVSKATDGTPRATKLVEASKR